MAVYACINEQGWVGAVTEQTIPDGKVPASYVRVDLSFEEAERTLLRCAYDAGKGAFGSKVIPVETVRLVSTGRFFDLFTFAERSAILAKTGGVDPVVTDLWARVQLGDPINLLSARVAQGLAYLDSKGVFGQTGAARIAAIIANQDSS